MKLFYVIVCALQSVSLREPSFLSGLLRLFHDFLPLAASLRRASLRIVTKRLVVVQLGEGGWHISAVILPGLLAT